VFTDECICMICNTKSGSMTSFVALLHPLLFCHSTPLDFCKSCQKHMPKSTSGLTAFASAECQICHSSGRAHKHILSGRIRFLPWIRVELSKFSRESRPRCLCDADAQDAKAAASSLQPLVDPKPAQPTPVIQMDATHKQLKSYLPGELCEAFRAAGMTHDLYDWQVCHHF